MGKDERQYEAIANGLARAIERGVYRPGERLPSVRLSSRSHKVAIGTALRAYIELEQRGVIEARPRSGFFVSTPRASLQPEPVRTEPIVKITPVDVSELVFRVLDEIKTAAFIPLGSAFPSPELFPFVSLRRAAASASRRLDPWSSLKDLPPGNAELRRQIAQRYQLDGCRVNADDLIVTNGALEAINLCLQAVVKAGDAVAIESPTFYATLQAIERLGLRAVEVPTDPRTGIDVGELSRVLKVHQIRACVLMSRFQNPMGGCIEADQQREIVQMLCRHEIPLIEDDVYAELHHGPERGRPLKHLDRAGLVMHCGSFAKCLAPGFRVGWVAAGRFQERLARLKVMTSIATASLPQAALAGYLRDYAFERHLRALRSKLAAGLQSMAREIEESFPAQCRVTRPKGGYFVWVELPTRIDALKLHALAEKERISLAPGPLFSAQRNYRNCIRLNFGHPWSAAMATAVRRLGALARELA